jgi:hypothetical protein
MDRYRVDACLVEVGADPEQAIETNAHVPSGAGKSSA